MQNVFSRKLRNILHFCLKLAEAEIKILFSRKSFITISANLLILTKFVQQNIGRNTNPD